MERCIRINRTVILLFALILAAVCVAFAPASASAMTVKEDPALAQIVASGGMELNEDYGDATQQMASGTYYITDDLTIEASRDTREWDWEGDPIAYCINALWVGSSNVTIYIPKGKTLKLYGANARTPFDESGAAIYLTTGTVTITGQGSLEAYGGNAGNGKSGWSGGRGYLSESKHEYFDIVFGSPGYGGRGGNGGFGAGAAIGTNGGEGGWGNYETTQPIPFREKDKTSGNWGVSTAGYFIDLDAENADQRNGNNGYAGSEGSSAEAFNGKVYIGSQVNVILQGGFAGQGGSGGNYGDWDKFDSASWVPGTGYWYTVGGGAGGGGGGGGYAAAAIGAGGAGGGGGGAGGSGGVERWYLEKWCMNVCGHGGQGGQGANPGSNGSDAGTYGESYSGGAGGGAGAAGAGGAGAAAEPVIQQGSDSAAEGTIVIRNASGNPTTLPARTDSDSWLNAVAQKNGCTNTVVIDYNGATIPDAQSGEEVGSKTFTVVAGASGFAPIMADIEASAGVLARTGHQLIGFSADKNATTAADCFLYKDTDGTHLQTASLVNGHFISDENVSDADCLWTACGNTTLYAIWEKLVQDPPTAKQGLKYNRSEQTGVALPKGETHYTLTGNKATDAGNYTATATLTKDYYTWSDGTTEPKTIPWSIGKADNSFSYLFFYGYIEGHEPEPHYGVTYGTPTFTYSTSEDGEFGPWSTDYPAGTYYGKATVEESDNYLGVTAVESFTVESVTVKVTPNVLSLDVGGTKTLRSNVVNGDSQDVIWSSTDESVATVSADGMVTGVSGGLARIVATSVSNPTKSGYCLVVVTDEIAGFSIDAADATYTGKAYAGPVVVSKDGKVLTASEYKISYGQDGADLEGAPTDVGTYQVTATGKGAFTGTLSATFTIAPQELTAAQVKLSASVFAYNGKAKAPAITVKNAAGDIICNAATASTDDIVITYAPGRTKIGAYTVTVAGQGNYAGAVAKTFKIAPAKTAIKTIAKGPKSFKVTWTPKAKAAQATGYQIRYSTSAKFAPAYTKTVTVTNYKTASKVVKNLKANKKYYVQIRTYKTVNGTKYRSVWSATKSVTTK